MSEIEFQKEVLRRMGQMDRDFSAFMARLEERCPARGALLDDHEDRISDLEAKEQHRKGGVAVLAFLLAGAGSIGGIAARMWHG